MANTAMYQILATVVAASIGGNVFAQGELQACSLLKPTKDGDLGDTRSLLVWQRCLIGQTGTTGNCLGEAKKVSWRGALEAAAQYAVATRNDWILPTKDQLDDLIRRCANSKVGELWTSTQDKSGGQYAWKVASGEESLTVAHTDQLGTLRLVRRSSVSDVRAFKETLTRQGLDSTVAGVTYQSEADDAARLEVEAKAAKREEEAQRKREAALAAEAARERSALFNKNADPKLLYLKAGKFERDRSTDKAKELYEFIIENFTSSDWAVKANDRLLSIGQTSTSSQNGRASSGGAQPFARLACVTWKVEWSTNPFFKNTDIVKYDVQGNFTEGNGGQCEVKIRSQRRTSIVPDSPPYKDNEVVILECAKLSPC